MLRPILLSAVCVAALGCATARDASAPAAANAPPAPASPASATGTKDGRTTQDRSLTSAEYVAAGFPSPDRTWNPSDYVRAHESLARLVSERDATVLPRFESPRSGQVFARLADRKNFAIVGDRSYAVGARLPMIVQGAQGVSQVLKLYIEAFFSSGGVAPELLDLSCLTLHAGRRMAELVAEVPVPDPAAPGRSKFDEGKRQVQSGLANAIHGSLVTLSDRTVDPRTRTRFAACLADEIPPCVRHLSPDMQTELRQRIARASADEPAGPAKPEVTRLATAVAPRR